MRSPEHKFQLYIVFAPDNKTGGITNGPELEPPQGSSLVETSSTTNQYLKAVKPLTSAVLGFTSEPVPPVLESNQSLPTGQSVTIDAEQIRAKRQEQFVQLGYIPPIVGGSPKQIDLPINEIVSLYRDQHVSTAEIAKRFRVGSETIYKRLHEAGELNLIGTRIGDSAFKQMDQEKYERWRVENEEALQKEKEEIRDDIRNTLGEEFLKQFEETERATKELIKKREEERMRKKSTIR
jgi:hypothetical protein